MKKTGTPVIATMVMIVLVLVSFVGCIGFWQDQLIFFPDTIDEDEDLSWTGASEEIFVDVEDGARIHGLFFDSQGPSTGVVLYFHGNAGSVASWYRTALKLTEYDVDVFLIDYRTYGKSTGDLSEQGLYLDGKAAYNYLIERGYAPDSIVVHGRSLGSAIASSVAAEYPVGALILETPFVSLMGLVEELYPFLMPRRLLRYELDNHGRVADIDAPTWVVHGTDDEVIPLSHGRRVFEALPNGWKMTVIEHGRHNNLMSFERYGEDASLFFQTVLPAVD